MYFILKLAIYLLKRTVHCGYLFGTLAKISIYHRLIPET